MAAMIALRNVIVSVAFLFVADAAAIASKGSSWDGDYVIVVPKALQRNAENKISVQIQSANVALQIDSNSTNTGKLVTGEVVVIPGGKGIVTYRIPFADYTESSVQLFFTAFECDGDIKDCAKSPGRQLFSANVSLPVLKVSLMIFTETSKPIYKPGDIVRYRMLALLADSLLPYQSSKKEDLVFDLVYLEAPNKMRMDQRKKLSWKAALNGLSFQLSPDPLYGKWKIVSQIGDAKDVEYFTVKEYVLPKFTVSVNPPTYVYIEDTKLKYSVCAKYSTGRPMRALVSAELCVKYTGYVSKSDKRKPRPCIRSVKVLDGTNECAEFEVNTNVLQLRNKTYRSWSTKAFVNATVIENGTDASVTKTAFGGRLETSSFKLVSKIADTSTYRQGLPFYSQVQTVNHDGSVRPYEKVRCSVETFFGSSWGFSHDYTSDARGMINFGIPPFPSDANTVSIYCRAAQKSSTSRRRSQLLQPSVPSIYQSVRKVFSPSNTHLQVYPLELQPAQKPCASGKVKVRLQSNVALHGKKIQALSTARGNIQTIEVFKTVQASAITCKDQDNIELGHYKCVQQEDGSYKVSPDANRSYSLVCSP